MRFQRENRGGRTHVRQRLEAAHAEHVVDERDPNILKD